MVDRSRRVHPLLSFWARQKRNWRVVVIRRIFNRFFSQLTVDYTDIYVRELGASPVQLGSVNAVASLASTALAVPIGALHDRYSLRRLFVFGSALVAIASLFYAFAYSWVMIIPAIILTKITARFHCSVICDLSLETPSRATGKSLCEGLGSIPSLFAPLMAAVLITHFGGISVDGIRPLYWLQFAAHAVLFLFIVYRLAAIRRPRAPSTPGFVAGYVDVFRSSAAVKRWILFYASSMFTVSMVTPFWYPFAQELKLADQYVISGMATIGILVKILLATPFGRVADRVGRKKVYYLLNPIVATAYLLLVLVPTPYPQLLLLPAVLRGFDAVSRIVIIGSMTPELIAPQYLGRWRGVLGLFGGLASILGPIVGGVVWETVGPSAVFLAAFAVDTLVALPIMVTLPETLTPRAADTSA
jgi:MFS family permease